MKDGSDAIADWPILNALVNTAARAHWVSVDHGGGVGIGYSIACRHGGGGGRHERNQGTSPEGAHHQSGDGRAAARRCRLRTGPPLRFGTQRQHTRLRALPASFYAARYDRGGTGLAGQGAGGGDAGWGHSGYIVETEAYLGVDVASMPHARTPRNADVRRRACVCIFQLWDALVH